MRYIFCGATSSSISAIRDRDIHGFPNPVRKNTEEMAHIPHWSYHTQQTLLKASALPTAAHPTGIQLLPLNILKLKIHDLESSLLTHPSDSSLSLPFPTLRQWATLEVQDFLLFLSTLSSQSVSLPPPALPLCSPSTGKSSSWFFSLKRADANWILAGLQFPGLWLQAEGGGRTGRGREAAEREKRNMQGTVLCDTTPTEGGICKSELGDQKRIIINQKTLVVVWPFISIASAFCGSESAN